MMESNDGLRHFLEQSHDLALSLQNRGPLIEGDDMPVASAITDAYWKYGFYVLKNVIPEEEINDLRTDLEDLLLRSPASSECTTDSSGRPLEFSEDQRKLFRFAYPLTDPYGETEIGRGRYQVKMSEPKVPVGAPHEVLLQIGGVLQFLDSALRIYGHPKLLALAEVINGCDFTPFTETIWIKQPRLGAAVSWHQDGTTHWNSPELDQGSHGFNFMVNLHETTVQNALWIVPGSHKHGKADLKQMVRESGSERIQGALPLLCKPGDVAICNRQVVHGSFPNTSPHPRYTFVFGFHRRSSVLGVQGWAKQEYSEEYIARSCRLIDIAINARKQRYPHEQAYSYTPSRKSAPFTPGEKQSDGCLKNYQRYAIGI